MTRPPDHPRLVAPVSGFAALWAHQVLSDALPGAMERFTRSGVHPSLLTQLPDTVGAIGAAGQVWLNYRVAVRGKPEVLVAEAGPVSGHEISTADAGALLGVTPRRVRQLAAAGVVDARRVGRCWLVDKQALELYRAVRRSA